MNYYQRLPLKKAYNVRDLGGYPAGAGQVTRWHRFLRADDLSDLDHEDIGFLWNYGVRGIVDLRSRAEVEKRPHPLAEYEGITYVNVPFTIDEIADVTKTIGGNSNRFLSEFYLSLLRTRGDALEHIFEMFVKCNEGCVLFHCAAGKDRTGVIAMLLLGLAGVDQYDIMTNYEVTYANLRRNPSLAEMAGGYPPEMMYSRAESMEEATDYILDVYGSVEEYLLSQKIPDQYLKKIKESFIVKDII